jgi:hypothetical protein
MIAMMALLALLKRIGIAKGNLSSHEEGLCPRYLFAGSCC